MIINLTTERAKREAPDPEFVRHDDYGRPIYCFTCSYDMGDRRFCTEVWAYDWPDAEARVAAMREGMKVEGQIYSVVPA